MEYENLWEPADPLGEALHFLRMSGTFYGRSELTAPWGLWLPPMDGCIWFHVVTSGSCWLEVEGREPLALRPGDFALVPHGEGHRLWSERGVPTPTVTELPQDYVSDRYSILRYGGGGAAVSLVCGAVRCDHPAARDLIALLPRTIHLDASSSAPHTEWMHSSLRFMAAEARALRPGGETVITRLSDVLVIQAIRSWIEHDPAARTGWLGALHDPQIGRALTLVHRDPSRDWTVASLAAELSMSRSAFAARFTQLVGEPRCSTSHAGGCTSPSTDSERTASPSASWRDVWATARKPRSAGPSSASSASRPARSADVDRPRPPPHRPGLGRRRRSRRSPPDRAVL